MLRSPRWCGDHFILSEKGHTLNVEGHGGLYFSHRILFYFYYTNLYVGLWADIHILYMYAQI